MKGFRGEVKLTGNSAKHHTIVKKYFDWEEKLI
jgi:hypothetical protein